MENLIKNIILIINNIFTKQNNDLKLKPEARGQKLKIVFEETLLYDYCFLRE